MLRTGTLPVPMQREISWWLATCHANGERVVNTSDWRRWAATAAEVVAAPGRGALVRGPDPGGVDGRVGAGVPRRPRPARCRGTRRTAETALRGLLPRLAVHYSDAPWWKHDLWCLRFDPRIPRREHEPHGDASVRWDDIAPPWLREGVKFYTCLQMESGQLTWSTVLQVHVFAARFGGFALSRGIGHPALADDPSQLRAAGAGLPGVPAAVAAGTARSRPGPRRAAGRAIGRPHPAVPRQLLRGR